MDLINGFMLLNNINQLKVPLRYVVDLENLIEDLNTYLDNNFDIYFVLRQLYI